MIGRVERPSRFASTAPPSRLGLGLRRDLDRLFASLELLQVVDRLLEDVAEDLDVDQLGCADDLLAFAAAGREVVLGQLVEALETSSGTFSPSSTSSGANRPPLYCSMLKLRAAFIHGARNRPRKLSHIGRGL